MQQQRDIYALDDKEDKTPVIALSYRFMQEQINQRETVGA